MYIPKIQIFPTAQVFSRESDWPVCSAKRCADALVLGPSCTASKVREADRGKSFQ